MSLDPEDSVLEEALRGDLPSAAVADRMRRRLLAAGVAVGSGTAVSSAAASGGAATGLVAKAAGVSWGIKLGFAAVITIPTVGLLIDGQLQTQTVASVASAQAPVVARTAAASEPALAQPHTASAPALVEREVAKAPRPTNAVESAARAAAAAPLPAGPSRASFTPPVEAPAAAPPKLGSTLAEETRLLDSAFAELAAGNRARASQLIAEHRARFPSGLLQKERERAKARLAEISRGE
jgi:hypothetical protein